jgi:Tol biopolymer transport system component
LLVGIAVLLGALLALAVLGRTWIETRLNALQPLAVGGRIAMPTDTGLAYYDLAQRRQTELLTTQPGSTTSSAAWSPDGSQIAYGFFHRRPEDSASVSEIYVVNADGSNPRVAAERDRPGTVLDSPVWSPDGRDLIFSYFGQIEGRPVQRIERLGLASGERTVVVDNGYAPALTPDGQTILFLRDERSGTGLWRAGIGGEQPVAIAAPSRFPGLAVPRVSPDGQSLTVAIMNTTTAELPSSSPLDWLLGPVAYAHGLPWDIWVMDLRGANPRRLTQINSDDPSPTWSPDGRYIAFWGGTGLYLVGADGSGLRQLTNRGGYGPIDWTR